MTTTPLSELKAEHKRIKARAQQDMMDYHWHEIVVVLKIAALWFSGLAGAALTIFLLSGCATEVRYPNGATALTMRSNATRVAFTGGGISFTADRIDSATPTYVALAGATDLTHAVSGGAFGLFAPSVTGAARAAVLLAPAVTPRYQKSAPRAPAQVVTP